MSNSSLTVQQLTNIFHEYSPSDIVKATRSTEAFANEVYDVTDSEGQRYFLKILKAQLPEVIAVEVQMQKRLHAAGIQAPEYLEVKPGQYVGHYADKRFLLSRFIPGSSPKRITPGLITNFGAILARVHDALEGITIPPNNMQWLNKIRVTKDLEHYDGPVKQDLATLIQEGSAIFAHNLPQAVTHGDLWINNVFADKNKVTAVFDLETAEFTVRLVDLARTFTSMKFNSNYPSDEIIKLLVSGYDSAATQPLTTQERDNLTLAIAFVAGACATWHAIHGTRYRDPYIAYGKEALGLS